MNRQIKRSTNGSTNGSTNSATKNDPATTTGGSVWDRLAHRYDRLWVQKVSLGTTREAVHRRLDGLIRQGKTAILDLGCGTGQLLGELEQRYACVPGLRLTGVDKSCGMIREAHKRGTGAILECLDVSEETLDAVVAPGSLDVVVCCHSFPYYTDKPGVLRKLRKALRPDGTMVFVQASINGWYDRLAMALIEKTAEQADYLSREAFRELVASEFEVVEEFDVAVRAFMPSICGFVLKKRSDR